MVYLDGHDANIVPPRLPTLTGFVPHRFQARIDWAES